MLHIDQSNVGPAGSPHPLRATAIVIYLTLALLAVTIPQSLVNWLRDMNGNPAQETLLRGAEALQSVADDSGVAAVYRRIRALFLAVRDKEDE